MNEYRAKHLAEKAAEAATYTARLDELFKRANTTQPGDDDFSRGTRYCGVIGAAGSMIRTLADMVQTAANHAAEDVAEEKARERRPEAQVNEETLYEPIKALKKRLDLAVARHEKLAEVVRTAEEAGMEAEEEFGEDSPEAKIAFSRFDRLDAVRLHAEAIEDVLAARLDYLERAQKLIEEHDYAISRRQRAREEKKTGRKHLSLADMLARRT